MPDITDLSFEKDMNSSNQELSCWQVSFTYKGEKRGIYVFAVEELDNDATLPGIIKDAAKKMIEKYEADNA